MQNRSIRGRGATAPTAAPAVHRPTPPAAIANAPKPARATNGPPVFSLIGIVLAVILCLLLLLAISASAEQPNTTADDPLSHPTIEAFGAPAFEVTAMGMSANASSAEPSPPVQADHSDSSSSPGGLDAPAAIEFHGEADKDSRIDHEGAEPADVVAVGAATELATEPADSERATAKPWHVAPPNTPGIRVSSIPALPVESDRRQRAAYIDSLDLLQRRIKTLETRLDWNVGVLAFLILVLTAVALLIPLNPAAGVMTSGRRLFPLKPTRRADPSENLLPDPSPPEPQQHKVPAEFFKGWCAPDSPPGLATFQRLADYHHVTLADSAIVSPWSLGSASAQGPVRSRNEDCVVAFDVENIRALVIADGMGGGRGGQEAARIACEAAGRDIIASAAYGRRTAQRDMQAFATRAVFAAGSALERWGEACNVTDPCAFRSTLAVVLLDDSSIGWAYIGDGALYIVRDDGAVEPLMAPQKGGAPNVLWASLGPTIDGGMISGTAKRRHGDVVIAGTDGCFDRVSSRFPVDLLTAALDFDGDLAKCVEHAVQEMCAARDQCGCLVFDDNITLAAAGSGRAPAFLVPLR